MGLLFGIAKEIAIVTLAGKANEKAKPLDSFDYSYFVIPHDTFRRNNFIVKDQEEKTLYTLKPNRSKSEKIKSYSARMDIYDSNDCLFASVKAYNTHNPTTLKTLNECSEYLKFSIVDGESLLEEAESNRIALSKEEYFLKDRGFIVYSEGMGLKHWVKNKEGEEIIYLEEPLLSSTTTISMKNPANLFISVVIKAMIELSSYEYAEYGTLF